MLTPRPDWSFLASDPLSDLRHDRMSGGDSLFGTLLHDLRDRSWRQIWPCSIEGRRRRLSGASMRWTPANRRRTDPKGGNRGAERSSMVLTLSPYGTMLCLAMHPCQPQCESNASAIRPRVRLSAVCLIRKGFAEMIVCSTGRLAQSTLTEATTRNIGTPSASPLHEFRRSYALLCMSIGLF